MSKITIINNSKFSSDARVVEVVAKFLSEEIGDDVDCLGDGMWKVEYLEGCYTLIVTGSSEVGNVKIKVTCDLNDIDD